MKLVKAIEILDLNIKSVGRDMPTDTLQALKLLTEAGKRLEKHRQGICIASHTLLPGED